MAEIDGVLVVDLDGTLYHGDAPVRAYADHAVAGLTAEQTAEILAELDRYLTGSGSTLTAIDGWEAVAGLAGRHGVEKTALDTAFLSSRARLADGSAVVTVPDGFAALLDDLRPTHRLILATNSPADGLSDLLGRIGMDTAFHEVVSGTGKPDGLRALLRRVLDAEGLAAQPWRIFSIGDHWRNDIEPALSLGAITGYVDRFGRADGPAHVRAATVTAMLPDIRDWATDPAGFRRTHPLPVDTRTAP